MTFLNTLKILLLAALVLFFTNIALQIISVYPQQEKIGTNVRINRFAPKFTYLVDLSYQKQPLKQKQIRRFIKYYQYIEANNLQEAQVQEILALCYFYNDQKNEAIGLYQQIIKRNSQSFWSNYNLAITYLTQKNLTAAKKYFQMALDVPIQETLDNLTSCKTYLQYIVTSHVSIPSLIRQLNDGYQKDNAYLESLLFYDSLNDPLKKEKFLNQLIQSAYPVIF